MSWLIGKRVSFIPSGPKMFFSYKSDRFSSRALDDLTEDNVIGVGILLAGSRREIHVAAMNRVVDQVGVGEGAERVLKLRFPEVVDGYVIDVARTVRDQHPHHDLIGGQQAWKPARDRVVEADAALLDEHEEERRHESLRDSADAIVYVDRRGHGGHRLAERHGQDLAVVPPNAEQDRLGAKLRGVFLDDGAHALRVRSE